MGTAKSQPTAADIQAELDLRLAQLERDRRDGTGVYSDDWGGRKHVLSKEVAELYARHQFTFNGR